MFDPTPRTATLGTSGRTFSCRSPGERRLDHGLVGGQFRAVGQGERDQVVGRHGRVEQLDRERRLLGRLDERAGFEPEEAGEVGAGNLPPLVGGLDRLPAARRLGLRPVDLDGRREVRGDLLGQLDEFLGAAEGVERPRPPRRGPAAR